MRKQGRIIGPIDMFLAAQALNKELIFVTNNSKEFEKVKGLNIKDWSIQS